MSVSRLLCSAAIVCLSSAALAQERSGIERLTLPPETLRTLIGEVPTLDGSLSEQVRRVARDDARRGASPGTVHVLLDFGTAPDGALFDEVRAAGVEILTKVSDVAWAARVDAESADRLMQSQLVAGAEVYPVTAKISTLFAEGGSEDASLDAGGEVSVTFFEDVSEEEAREALSTIGVETPGAADQSFEVTRTLPAALPEGGLLPIALLDEVQMIEPTAPPDISFNLANAQPLSNVDDVQAPPFNLDGSGVTLGIWEAGAVVRATHQDLTPRVTVSAGQTSTQSRHANHVAGTMVSSGANTPAAEGMAPAANLLSWDSPSDFIEMSAAAGASSSPRISASNHSYGQRIGWDPGSNSWNNNQGRFGSYTTGDSAALDRVIAGNATGTVAATELVSVWAAGNDRNDAPLTGVSGGAQDCLQGGLTAPGGGAFFADCIGPDGIAKNVITVGAMNGGGAMSTFSSYGPTDDGRIKPDLMAHGVSTLSLGTQSGAQTDTGTYPSSGTSMAAPVVAGIAGLMTQEFDSLSLSPLAASYKAILIQTARDVNGVDQSLPGPDFATGWGIADAEAALQLIRRAGGPGFAEGTVAATGTGGAWTFPFVVPAGMPDLRLTLAWSDLPSAAGGGLVNDLDLRLVPPGGGAPRQPFAPNATSPWLAAGTGDNTADNVEQVLVQSPAAGTWTAQVTAKPGSLLSGPQRFAIAGPITPDEGPIDGPKSDIVMVLDKSGSMRLPSATAGLTKMEALQDAATAMVDYLELVGGHGLSVVAFDSSVSPTTPSVGLAELDAGHADDARQAVGNLSAGGATGIIAGVTEAATRLASPAATNPSSTVVLFSDGRHNTPAGSDVGAIDSVMDEDTRFFSIGFGTDVDSSVMPGVAGNHDGVHIEEQTLSAGQLAKLFMVVAGLAADEQIIIDPDYDVSPGKFAQQPVFVAREDRSLTFAMFWDTPGRPMDFLVTGPDRRCKIVDRTHDGYALQEGKRHRIIRIDLPYTCEGGPSDGLTMHDGAWAVQARNRGDDGATVKVMALAETTTRLMPDIDVEGRKAILTARLHTEGKPVSKGLRIRAEITPNKPSTGDSERQDGVDRGPNDGRVMIPGRGGTLFGGGTVATGEDTPSIAIDIGRLRDRLIQPDLDIQLPRDVIDRLIRGIDRLPVEPAGPMTVDLRDDGLGADMRAGDGIFTAALGLTSPVLHNVRMVAEQARSGGVLTREYLTSFAVK